MYDLVIRGGTIIDGTGAARYDGDVAISDDRIVAVGEVDGRGRREIDAHGALVTPGWIDIHTHYDGQAMWDPYLTPSSWHGCTSVVMGNCGVGFAPVPPGQEDWLIELMESVEDIPGAALAEGLDWSWESFPQYLDALDGRARAIDIATQVPHCAVRAYVMGERCITQTTASPSDIDAMAAIVRQGLEAGAVGFSTSRTVVHRTKDGDEVPGTFAGEEELYGIARGMQAAGHGVFQMASDLGEQDGDLRWMSRLSKDYGVPVSVNLFQNDGRPRQYQEILANMAAVNGEGAQVYAQVSGRTAGLLLSLDGTMHPFMSKSAYRALRQLPHAERVAQMRKPEVRAAILAHEQRPMSASAKLFLEGWHKMFRLGDPPCYEPDRSECFAERAKREGTTPEALAYDALLEFDGRGLIYFPLLNYADYNFDPSFEMMQAPNTHFGGSDGGAHCGVICDVSLPTFNLAYWCRDRDGAQLPLEFMVHKQTQGTASLHGFADRGVLKPGYLADMNVIDFERLNVRAPHMAFDLPTDARRLIQHADGYLMTVKSGQAIYEGGEPTGALPGGLLRGPQML
ncbi:MAG: amidohydrolase family protein [Pseudomonadota bacterium]